MKKMNVYLALVLAGGVMFFAGRLTARSGSFSQKTQGNLSTAMHGEAFAYAKYLLYPTTLVSTATPNWRTCLEGPPTRSASSTSRKRRNSLGWSEVTQTT